MALEISLRSGPAGDSGKMTNSLLGLPRELRDEIFSYVIVKPRSTVITMLSNYDCFKSEVSACQPALAGVNHQIRNEVLPAFYGFNTFLAEISEREDLATATRWLNTIGDDNVRSLRRLALCGWTRVPFGHMISQRWVKVVLDLKEGTLELEPSNTGEMTQHPHIEASVEGLRESFRRLSAEQAGRQAAGFDAASAARLMRGFHGLCRAV